MDVTINERLKHYVECENISPPDLYKKIGVHRSIWSGWMNQGKAISVEKLVALFRAIPEMNARWLLTGEGYMKILTGADLIESKNDFLNYNPNNTGECLNCKAKEKENEALKIAIGAKEELLEMYRKKIGV